MSPYKLVHLENSLLSSFHAVSLGVSSAYFEICNGKIVSPRGRQDCPSSNNSVWVGNVFSLSDSPHLVLCGGACNFSRLESKPARLSLWVSV
jgi:hypothetical protein